MEFLRTFEIYTKVVSVVDIFINILFRLTDDVATALTTGVTAAAAIYIALMGYAYMSGWIAMSQRELAIRFGKVILILVLLRTLTGFSAGSFEAIWAIPESVGDFIASKIFPLYDLGPINLLLGSGSPADFEGLVNISGIGSSVIADQVGVVHGHDSKYPVIVWALSMAPIALVIISILIAKIVTAVLFVIAPFILILSLLGFQNNFLYSWFKVLLSTFVTVIIIYAVGTIGVMMVLAQMALLFIPDISTLITFLSGPDIEVLFSLPRLAPLGITAVFVVMLITQAPQIAAALIGAASISTQQATSFIQVAALQSAAKTSS